MTFYQIQSSNLNFATDSNRIVAIISYYYFVFTFDIFLLLTIDIHHRERCCLDHATVVIQRHHIPQVSKLWSTGD